MAMAATSVNGHYGGDLRALPGSTGGAPVSGGVVGSGTRGSLPAMMRSTVHSSSPSDSASPAAIEVNALEFSYPGQAERALSGIALRLPRAARCLVVGANGAGKSTLLQVLGGRLMVPEPAVRVLGRPAFHDTTLVRDVVQLGGEFRFEVDLGVDEILATKLDVDPARRGRLLDVLEVSPRWRMHQLSDGQRRRVQLLLGLLAPRQVILCDEITTHLDLLARIDLLSLLRRECEERQATVVYATHILDGLDGWATHILHLARGRVVLFAPVAEVQELDALRAAGVATPLLQLVEGWLRRARPRR